MSIATGCSGPDTGAPGASGGSNATGGAGGGAGAGGAGAATPDPLSAPPICTSGQTWGGRPSALMDPGGACIQCHSSGKGPAFAFAGTVYPTAHEPDNCYGVNGLTNATGAEVVVTDSRGMVFNVAVTPVGNFSLRPGGAVAPFRAKVTFMGRERVMAEAVPTGDCNVCHTQAGTTVVQAAGALKAPGRIVLP